MLKVRFTKHTAKLLFSMVVGVGIASNCPAGKEDEALQKEIDDLKEQNEKQSAALKGLEEKIPKYVEKDKLLEEVANMSLDDRKKIVDGAIPPITLDAAQKTAILNEICTNFASLTGVQKIAIGNALLAEGGGDLKVFRDLFDTHLAAINCNPAGALVNSGDDLINALMLRGHMKTALNNVGLKEADGALDTGLGKQLEAFGNALLGEAGGNLAAFKDLFNALCATLKCDSTNGSFTGTGAKELGNKLLVATNGELRRLKELVIGHLEEIKCDFAGKLVNGGVDLVNVLVKKGALATLFTNLGVKADGAFKAAGSTDPLLQMTPAESAALVNHILLSPEAAKTMIDMLCLLKNSLVNYNTNPTKGDSYIYTNLANLKL